MGEALEVVRAVAVWLGVRGASGRGSGTNEGVNGAKWFA
jgi:hypothetical protein